MAASLLTRGTTRIGNVPGLQDVYSMARVLENLGVKVRFDSNSVVIDTSDFDGFEAPYDLVRKMRASYYVLGPLVAVMRKARVSLPGGCTIGARPVNLHLKGLRALGAEIDIVHGYIEAQVEQLTGSSIELSGARGSSVGATINTMMAAARAGGTTVIHGAAMEPEVEDVAGFIRSMGGDIEGDGSPVITIRGREELVPTQYDVFPDRIEAGTFGVAAVMTGGEVLIEKCNPSHLESVLNILKRIGVEIETYEKGFSVACEGPGQLESFSVEATQYPGFPTDMQAQFMAMATLIPGESSIKESIFENRFLHAVELARMGARISLVGPVASVKGVEKLSGAPVMASDLRASAALVLAGLAAEGETSVYRIYHLDRGYDGLEEKLGSLGAKCERVKA